MSTTNLRIRKAYDAFKRGDFHTAKFIYKSLAKSIGARFFEANIILCDRRLKELGVDNKGHLDFSSFDVDELMQIAEDSLNQTNQIDFQPISGRIVLVVNSYPVDNGMGYANRHIKMAKKLKDEGFDVLCLVHPGEVFDGIESQSQAFFEKVIDDIKYVGSHKNGEPDEVLEYFDSCVKTYAQFFQEYRPECVIAADDFTSALPAIVAAKKINLPVLKENIHFAEAFLNKNKAKFYSSLEFSKKYAIEQACLQMADGDYYIFQESHDNWLSVFEKIRSCIGKQKLEKPVAILKPKGIHTIECDIESPGLYYCELDVEVFSGEGSHKGIVSSFRFYDVAGKVQKGDIAGFKSSKTYPVYEYVSTAKEPSNSRLLVFMVPADTKRLEIDIVSFVADSPLMLKKAECGPVNVESVANWLNRSVPGVQWIKAVSAYVHQEGATSLRLALLNRKYACTNHVADRTQLDGAVQELVELERTWIPTIYSSDKVIQIKETDKLTVAHLHKTAYPYENTGGAIRCLNTVLSQRSIGIEPYIITPIGYPRSADVENAKSYEVIEGIEHFRIGANTDGLRGLSLPDRTRYSAFYLAKLIKQRGANVIHAASGVRGYELALQALALKKLTGLPLLYEVRSFHEHTWTPVRDDVMNLEKTQLRVIKEDFCMAEADFVTTISYSMKKILIERGVPPEKIEVIPNAIDEHKYLGKTFEPATISALKGADIVVGYISNMSRREGHQYLIRAIHKLRQATGRDVRGLLVGNGPERESLERLASGLGVRDVIAFPGEVDHSQINAYYKAIDLFVIPRIPDYAADWVTPLKPYEAMALELPIIVTDLPALKEIVGENEERGLVAKPADVQSLVEQLQRYIDDPFLRQQKVAVAKEWVFAERTWSANAKRYETIYRRLIAQQHQRVSEKEPLHA